MSDRVRRTETGRYAESLLPFGSLPILPSHDTVA